MGRIPRLGPVNLALVALYFTPVWGRDALQALLSPYAGLDNRAHAAVASYFRELFDFGLEGLIRTSNVLAGIKLVIAAGFVAYLIDFARAVVVGRELNRETADGVLALAASATLVWALPALTLDDPGLVRLSATQLMLVAGAVVVITVERQVEQTAKAGVPASPPNPKFAHPRRDTSADPMRDQEPQRGILAAGVCPSPLTVSPVAERPHGR